MPLRVFCSLVPVANVSNCAFLLLRVYVCPSTWSPVCSSMAMYGYTLLVELSILNSLCDYPFGLSSPQFSAIFLPKHLQSDPQIVGNTTEMTPSHFLKKSLNSLFIDPGVLVNFLQFLVLSFCGLLFVSGRFCEVQRLSKQVREICYDEF